MEAEVIISSLPELVTAVSDCVQSVSDQCLAKGLIPDAVYKRVLESGATSEDKARTLVLAVKKSTETDKRCFELFMNVLEQELPYAVRDSLLEKMRREANEKASSCTAVVPSTGDLRQKPRGELSRESVVQQKHLLETLEEAVRQHQRACDEKEEKLKAKTEECDELKRALKVSLSVSDEAKDKISTREGKIGDLRQIPRGELARESVVQQTHLLGRLEEAVRQHEHARVEKIFLEEKLKAKTEKCEKWKARFQALQTKKLVSKKAAEAKSKIAACESEIENLKERVEEVEKLITEQDMQVKRVRNSVVLRTKDMFGRIAQESHATAWEKAREEMRLKEQEMKMNMKDQEMSTRERSREYKETIQEKDARIKEKDDRIREKKGYRVREKYDWISYTRELEAGRKRSQTSDTSIANPPDMIIREDIKHLWKGHGDDECEVDKWKRLGLELGFTSEEISPTKRDISRLRVDALAGPSGPTLECYESYRDTSPTRRDISLTRLLEEWADRYPRDSRGTKTFATYSGLKTALVNAGLGDMARDLRSYDEIQEIRMKREREEREREEREREERESYLEWLPEERECRRVKRPTMLSKLKSWF